MGKSVINFWSTTVGKTVKTALYLAASAVISYLLTLATNSPSTFGIFLPVVNVLLVAGKNFVDKQVPNTTKG